MGKFLNRFQPSLPGVRGSVLAGFLLAPGLASAQSTSPPSVKDLCNTQKKHIEVSFADFPQANTTEVVISDLAAELASRKIGVCPPNTRPEAPLSIVTVERREASSVRIEVIDSLTRKRVTRSIRLDSAMQGASGLVIAVAIDELLRATWAELSLRSSTHDPAPRQAAPPLEDDAPTSTSDDSARHRLGLAGAVDFYPAASTFWGADLSYAIQIHPVVELSFAAGPRMHRKHDIELPNAATGEVRAHALFLSASLGVSALQGSRFAAGPRVSLSGAYAWFTGNAEPPSRSGAHGGFVAQLSAGLFFRYLIGKAYLQAQSEWGAPLLGLAVTNGRERVGGLFKMVSSNRVACGLWWP